MEKEKALERYAVIKVRMKELKKEEDELKPLILKAVSDNGEPIKRDYGTFVKTVKPNWKYSDSLTKDIENISIRKIEEQEDKTAINKPKEHLTCNLKNKNV